MKYYWHDGEWVEAEQFTRPEPVAPFVWRDLPPYKSPLGTGVIDGRRARREDMARAGVREMDPSERPAINPKTAKQAEMERASLLARQPTIIPEHVTERLKRG